MKNRKLILILAAMTVVAFVAAAMVSCKKELEQSVVDGSHGECALNRILGFKQQLEEALTAPDAKSTSYLSADDAVWNIEALFNLYYAYPELSFGKTVAYDTILYLPVSANDLVSISDLAVFYGKMFETVQAVYNSIVLPNKQFLILDVERGEREGDLLPIELHSLQGVAKGTPDPHDPVPWPGPFAEGSPWYYGEDGGRLDGTFYSWMDAADTLSNMLNAVLVPQPSEGEIYFYTGTIMKQLESGDHIPFAYSNFPGNYCEFYVKNPSSDDYWLSYEQMNFQYFGERHLALNVFPADQTTPIPSGHSLFNVTITDFKNIIQNNVDEIGHHTCAYYGRREVLGENVIIKGNL
ncbi:MAG: hypothetical protein II862_05555 [Bacteroidales bacterium]|nr:hypothetical protein [Bacteroidales bacterium]